MAEMTLIISAVDKATAVAQAVAGSFDGMKSKLTSAFDSIKANFTSLHFAITDAMQLIGKAFEAIERYAGFAEIKEQLNLMAGQFSTTGDSIVASLKEVTGGQLSLEQATKTAAAALKNSLTPEQILGLAKAAAAFADTAGVTVAQAFDTLTEAVSKGNARAVASITGKDGLGDAMKTLESSATDAEKTMAVFNAVMEKTDAQLKLTGEATQGLADSIDSAKASWSDFTLKIAEYATTAAYGVAGVFTALAAALTRVAAAASHAYSALAVLQGNFQAAADASQTAKDLWGSASELSAKADGYMKLAGEVGKADAVVKAAAKSVEAQTTALTNSASAVDSANEKWKLINGTWTATDTASTVAVSGMEKVKTAADSIPKDIQVKVTTTYVEVRKSGAEEGAVATIGANGEASYGNWGGAY